MSPEDGGSLRAQLETALEQLKEANAKVRSYELRDTLTEEGIDLVKPEDLGAIESVDEALERARELQSERVQFKIDALIEAGIEADEAKRIVAEKGKVTATEKPKVPPVDGDATKRIQAGGKVETGKVPDTIDTKGLVGDDKIRAHFASKDK